MTDDMEWALTAILRHNLYSRVFWDSCRINLSDFIGYSKGRLITLPPWTSPKYSSNIFDNSHLSTPFSSSNRAQLKIFDNHIVYVWSFVTVNTLDVDAVPLDYFLRFTMSSHESVTVTGCADVPLSA